MSTREGMSVFYFLASTTNQIFPSKWKETCPTTFALLSPSLDITVSFYDITVFNTYIFLYVLLTQGRRALKYKLIIKGG